MRLAARGHLGFGFTVRLGLGRGRDEHDLAVVGQAQVNAPIGSGVEVPAPCDVRRSPGKGQVVLAVGIRRRDGRQEPAGHEGVHDARSQFIALHFFLRRRKFDFRRLDPAIFLSFCQWLTGILCPYTIGEVVYF